MKKIKIVKYSFFLFTSFILISCKKFVEVPIPRNQLVTSQVFADSAGATQAVLGIYIDIMQLQTLTPVNGGITVSGGLVSDELFTTSTLPNVNEMYSNAISVNNSLNADLWRYGYRFIYNINACIDGLSQSTGLITSLRDRLIAECKVSRAFLYFLLVNLYGDVPIITKIDYKINQAIPRSSVSAVYTQILTDLTEAKGSLPVTYPSAGKQRPNKHTATALLAKVYLYLKDWVKAESEATEIISSGTYNLSTLAGTFLTNSTETIWSMESILTTIETYEGSQLYPATTVAPRYPITDNLRSSFESGDQRLGNWIKSQVNSGVTYYFPSKYKARTRTATPASEHYIVFRFSEQYLIRAEAREQQNNLAGAISDLNIIRMRAGLSTLPNSLNQTQVIMAVEKERRSELFAEWGNRWFDLKRWGKADAVLAPVKGINWQSTDVLFPIPQNELNNNHLLTQNNGY